MLCQSFNYPHVVRHMICPVELADEASAFRKAREKASCQYAGTKQSTEAAWERAMNVHEVVLRAIAKTDYERRNSTNSSTLRKNFTNYGADLGSYLSA